MKLKPWFKFYAQDWKGEQALRLCSPAAHGLLINLMAMAHDCDPYGYLKVSGIAITSDMAAKMLCWEKEETQSAWDELVAMKRIIQDDEGCWLIQRMVKDHAFAEQASDAGKKGWNVKTNKGTNKATPKGTLKPEGDKETEGESEKEKTNWVEVKESWNVYADKYDYIRALQKITGSRKTHYLARLKSFPDFWSIVDRQMGNLQDFVKAGTWFGFDWLIKSDVNFTKFAEGAYRDKSKPQKKKQYANSKEPS